MCITNLYACATDSTLNNIGRIVTVSVLRNYNSKP